MTERNLSHLTTYHRALMQIVAYRVIQNRVNEMINGYGLITTQWIILGHLHEQQTSWRFSEIANLLQVENPLVSRLMQPLVDEGLVSVTIPEEDKRAKLAEITLRGSELVMSLEPKLMTHLEPITRAVGEEDMLTYFKALSLISSSENHL